MLWEVSSDYIIYYWLRNRDYYYYYYLCRGGYVVVNMKHENYPTHWPTASTSVRWNLVIYQNINTDLDDFNVLSWRDCWRTSELILCQFKKMTENQSQCLVVRSHLIRNKLFLLMRSQTDQATHILCPRVIRSLAWVEILLDARSLLFQPVHI